MSTERPSVLGRVRGDAGREKEMPPPMTFATMIAAASNGPRRRSSDAGSDEGMDRVEAGVAAMAGEKRSVGWSVQDQLPLNVDRADFHPPR
jgi:hypothetical protein